MLRHLLWKYISTFSASRLLLSCSHYSDKLTSISNIGVMNYFFRFHIKVVLKAMAKAQVSFGWELLKEIQILEISWMLKCCFSRPRILFNVPSKMTICWFNKNISKGEKFRLINYQYWKAIHFYWLYYLVLLKVLFQVRKCYLS